MKIRVHFTVIIFQKKKRQKFYALLSATVEPTVIIDRVGQSIIAEYPNACPIITEISATYDGMLKQSGKEIFGKEKETCQHRDSYRKFWNHGEDTKKKQLLKLMQPA